MTYLFGTTTPTYSGARVKSTANQSLSSDSLTAIAFAGEDFDTDTYHDNATNNTRITIPTTAKYQVGYNVIFDVNATGGRGVYIRLNGSTYIHQNLVGAATGASQTTGIVGSTTYAFTAGDYVEILGVQKSGGALNVLAADATDTHAWINRK